MQRTWVLFLFVFTAKSFGQISAEIFRDGNPESIQFRDSIQFKIYLEDKKLTWVRNGYFFSGIDSIVHSGGILKAYLHKGQKYLSNVFGKEKITTQAQARLNFLINNGYPFANLSLDSLTLNGDILSGKVQVTKGPEILLDSLHLFSEIKTNQSYIQNLLELRLGEPFSEDDYRSIEARVSRSSFLQLNRPPDISFQQNKARIYLDLARRRTNRFGGILGLQQNSVGQSIVIGSLSLEAENFFKSGHQFNFFWERFSEASQQLNIFYLHSFLFNAPISPSFRFDLLKQDSTFLTRTWEIGLNLYLFNSIRFSSKYEVVHATLLTDDILVLEGKNLGGFRRHFYHISLAKGYPKQLSTPKEGLSWNFSIGIGDKKIEKSLKLPRSYFDTLDLKTNFFKIDAMVIYQKKLFKKNRLFHQIRAGILENNEVLANELYRVGGLNSLRGFNEKEFFAQAFIASRLELRSFFEQGSFLYLSYDHLIFTQKQQSGDPFGIGLGFALETQTGQFNFAFASGNSDQQSISFTELRIHFGYTATF